MKEQIWFNRDEFMLRVEQSSPTAGLRNKDDAFSLTNIDIQLSGIIDKGVIFLRTRPNKFDLEEFAVHKVGGVWKFSTCPKVLENTKYAAEAR